MINVVDCRFLVDFLRITELSQMKRGNRVPGGRGYAD